MRIVVLAAAFALASCHGGAPDRGGAGLPALFARSAESATDSERAILARAAAVAPKDVTLALVDQRWVAYSFSERRPDGLYVIGRVRQFDANGDPAQTISVEEKRQAAPGPIAPTDDLAVESTEWLTRDLVVTFLGAAYNSGRLKEALDSLVAPDVINHAAAGTTKGRDAFAAYVTGPEGLHDAHDPKAVVVQNDLAATMSLVILHGAGGERRFMKFDVFRFCDGQICEHWAIRQPV